MRRCPECRKGIRKCICFPFYTSAGSGAIEPEALDLVREALELRDYYIPFLVTEIACGDQDVNLRLELEAVGEHIRSVLF